MVFGLRFPSTHQRDELAEVALDLGDFGMEAPTFGRQLATEEDAADLIAALEFDVDWVKEWVEKNPSLILPSFFRNSGKRFARALGLLASNDIEAEVGRVNNRQGPDAYEDRQSWRLLAMAAGLKDVSFWDASLGQFVESFVRPDPDGDEQLGISFPDRTQVLVIATEAVLDPAFSIVWIPGKITYRIQR